MTRRVDLKSTGERTTALIEGVKVELEVWVGLLHGEEVAAFVVRLDRLVEKEAKS